MSFLFNINGKLCRQNQAKISVLDRGFLYGDSVYEVVRTYEGRIFALTEHLKRLEHSASRLNIELPNIDWLKRQLLRTVSMAKNADSYCRLIVTRGSGPITLDPTLASKPQLVIIVKKYERFPDWMYQKGIKAFIPSIRRNSRASLDPAIKSGNYLNSVLALGEARKAGFHDALLLDAQGRVTEATSSNVFVFKDGILKTPTLETGILQGVTRSLVLQLVKTYLIPHQEGDIYSDDLVAADEVLVTSTLKEVMPVVQVGDHQIGDGRPGPLGKKLRDLVHEYALAQVRESNQRKPKERKPNRLKKDEGNCQ